jgi:hypothetical protein
MNSTHPPENAFTEGASEAIASLQTILGLILHSQKSMNHEPLTMNH